MPAHWRFAAIVLALAGAAVIVLWLSGGLTGTPSRATRVPAAGAGPPSLAAAAQAQAAAWIAAQVSGDVIVACYPDMCAALQEQGVSAGRLMPLRSAAASPLGASVLVTYPSVRGQLADQYAPALVASFGSGGTRIEVRAVEPGGAAAYQSALRADLAARRARDLSCSGTRISASPARTSRNSGRARWIPACWRRWRRWRPSTRSA